MKKKRLLIANDCSILGTGYAVYGQELLSRLQNSGKYEIAEIACYAEVANPTIRNLPWKVYPNAVNGEHPQSQAYRSNPINQFGSWRFNQCCLHFKPDIVFDIRDYWMYSFQETSPLRKSFKWVIMPTVDSAPQKDEWLFTFANADLIVPYTDWAKETLSRQCGRSINLFHKIANAGVDLGRFVPPKNRKALQKEFFGKDVEITGAVMRNQKRKLFPDLFEAYRKYLDRLLAEGKTELYNKSYLYLHTSYPEENGWDLPGLLLEHGILDKVYCTYTCRSCGKVYPAKFNQSVGVCKHCGVRSVIMPSASNPIGTQDLINIYGIMDYFVQYAICEGFGMPQVEAASCGIPLASVDYSAMSEIVRNLNGTPVPVQRFFRELETGADRAYPDNSVLVDALYDYFVNKTMEERENISKEVRKLCEKYYSWDDVFKVWDEAFDSVDVSDNESYTAPTPRPPQTNIKVPMELPPVEFIEFILNTIVNEPYLANTAPVRQLMRNYGCGIFAGRGSVAHYRAEDVMKQLEAFLNNKFAFEQLKANPTELFKEDYFNV